MTTPETPSAHWDAMTDQEKKIPLTQGKFAIVDSQDYERVNQFKWCFNRRPAGDGYAQRSKYGGGRQKPVLLHRFIMGAKSSEFVDHVNGDKLDCRRSNLRISSVAGNNQNRRPTKHSSKYKGVYWKKTKKRWIASIYMNGKQFWLGTFHNEKTAASAYDEAARELFGEFAYLNFPS